MQRSLRRGLGALVVGLTTLALAAPAQAGPPTPASARPAVTTTADSSSTSTPAERTVAAMQPGWNLGNTFDAVGADETAWGNPVVTRALLRTVHDQGFRSIRIPVTWGQHEGAAPGYTIDAAFLDRVQQVVDWALAEHLYVVLDVHHDSWMWTNAMGSNHDAVLAQFTATWRQIAQRFRSYPDHLLFESINEPQFDGTTDEQGRALLDELNTTFHAVVRDTGGKDRTRLLVLPALHTSSDQASLDDLAASFDALDDPNLVATVHYYGYWPFSVNIAGGYRFDATAQQDVADMFARVTQTFRDHHVPVILGEYGLLGFDVGTDTVEHGEMLKFFEDLGYQARVAGVTTMLWDNGQQLGRTTLQWSDPTLYQELRSSWTTRSGTASTDQVFVRPDAVTAQTVTLEPHGTRFVALAVGKRVLRPGVDYTRSGDDVTLSVRLLRTLVGDGSYGVHATLTARFSRGLPWTIDVIAAGTPSVSGASSATGTTDGLAIPTQFRGDRLATMEATYADGSGAGPNSWTTYKQFGTTFQPDAAAGTITLTPAFFAEVTDGAPVTLTFHFWSGATLTYTVVRSGDTVTGTAGTVGTAGTA